MKSNSKNKATGLNYQSNTLGFVPLTKIKSTGETLTNYTINKSNNYTNSDTLYEKNFETSDYSISQASKLDRNSSFLSNESLDTSTLNLDGQILLPNCGTSPKIHKTMNPPDKSANSHHGSKKGLSSIIHSFKKRASIKNLESHQILSDENLSLLNSQASTNSPSISHPHPHLSSFHSSSTKKSSKYSPVKEKIKKSKSTDPGNFFHKLDNTSTTNSSAVNPDYASTNSPSFTKNKSNITEQKTKKFRMKSMDLDLPQNAITNLETVGHKNFNSNNNNKLKLSTSLAVENTTYERPKKTSTSISKPCLVEHVSSNEISNPDAKTTKNREQHVRITRKNAVKSYTLKSYKISTSKTNLTSSPEIKPDLPFKTSRSELHPTTSLDDVLTDSKFKNRMIHNKSLNSGLNKTISDLGHKDFAHPHHSTIQNSEDLNINLDFTDLKTGNHRSSQKRLNSEKIKNLSNQRKSLNIDQLLRSQNHNSTSQTSSSSHNKKMSRQISEINFSNQIQTQINNSQSSNILHHYSNSSLSRAG